MLDKFNEKDINQSQPNKIILSQNAKQDENAKIIMPQNANQEKEIEINQSKVNRIDQIQIERPRILQKIQEKDFKKCAYILAENFKDYPLYSLLFKRDKNFVKKIYYTFCCEVYDGLDYTYANADFSLVTTVKRPEDISRGYKSLLANPFFSIPFFLTVGNKACKLGTEYSQFCQEAIEKYIKPQDIYLKNICIDPKARGKKLLQKTLYELVGDRSSILETHTKVNMSIYEHLGFTLMCERNFHGVDHFVMRR
ncbi:MAG: hypothetical protein RR248_04420 [Clostridia bacterium]